MDLFGYGTLMFPDVLDALLGRVPRLAPATAAGWRVAALPGLPYPGLVRDEAATARGSVLHDLRPAECRLLDAYEGTGYLRMPIQLTDGTRCASYVWQAAALPASWDPQRFAAQRLAGYVDGCLRWRAARRGARGNR